MVVQRLDPDVEAVHIQHIKAGTFQTGAHLGAGRKALVKVAYGGLTCREVRGIAPSLPAIEAAADVLHREVTNQLPPRTQHAGGFPQCRVEVGHMLEDVERDDRVENSVLKR